MAEERTLSHVLMKIVSTVFVQFGEIILSGRVKNNWSKKRHGRVCIVNNVTFRVKLAVVNECKIAACPYSAYMSMFIRGSNKRTSELLNELCF